ncbi:HD domain-containing protein [Alteribacter populi]|uniref:HD domain-containing protein n=1 Tax=Alteribacter populi TaxID=2011011 RepID=UPI000BBB5802|nr:HD domain-containing protein [Alteribacter populi]
MNQATVIKKAEQWAWDFFKHDHTGHDWYHTHRVRSMAVKLAEEEGGDPFICELAALLHDLADDKFYPDEETAKAAVKDWLINEQVNEVDLIVSIIASISFRGGKNTPPVTLEAKIVQDADRLEALGALGIARCFMYAGAKGDEMYDPEVNVREEMSLKEYREGKSTAINHFYEKLLKLRERMNTLTGKRLAYERHAFLEQYLHQFFAEWQGEK